ncbi:MAG: hypothetical protein CMJ78_18810 [Planctomycetaceae bacterium]|nr:hypothetical protein [Planctomycetaceae bacterium]
MYRKIVSLLLMTALIVCPVWCGDGFCIAGQCCVDAKHEVPSSTVAPCCADCDEEHGDLPCPSDSGGVSCQGICGGAIVQKPVVLDHRSEDCFQPLIVDEAFSTARLTDCLNERTEQHCCGSGPNQGRSMRTLHMSFLC